VTPTRIATRRSWAVKAAAYERAESGELTRK
jgi:hypothetical protein